MKLTGNTVLITGGNSGIGRGLAEAFHALGNKVIITGRQKATLDEVKAALPGTAAYILDVSDPVAIQKFAAEVVVKHPDLNVVIHNAGIVALEDLKSPASVTAAESEIATNLLGPIRLNAVLLPHLLAQAPRPAAVMTNTSVVAFVPFPKVPTYNATKAGLHSWTVSLREQLRGTNVEVVELPPPQVRTPIGGEKLLNNLNALSVKDYVDESFALLAQTPTPHELIVERAKPIRYAERNGAFDAVLEMMNKIEL